MTDFQPMPPLTEDQLDALRADIEANGILVPVVVDQYGRLLDGHNRSSIAAELGIDCPRTVVEVADDAAAMDMAVTLNCARRHLNQEQRRALIRAELRRSWADADRAIARRVGCSPSTVGTVRAEIRYEAERRTEAAREAMRECCRSLFRACQDLMLLGADPRKLIEHAALGRDKAAAGMRRALKRRDQDGADEVAEDTRDLIGSYVYTCLVNDLTDIVADLESDGIVLPLPQKVSDDELSFLMLDACSMLTGPVQIGQRGGVR